MTYEYIAYQWVHGAMGPWKIIW